jgi:hypothetical protein
LDCEGEEGRDGGLRRGRHGRGLIGARRRWEG